MKLSDVKPIFLILISIVLLDVIGIIMLIQSMPVSVLELANDYSGLLSFGATSILVIVTCFYAVSSHKQSMTAEKSTELIAKQIQLSRQPCVVPSISSTFGTKTDDKYRDFDSRRLTFTLSLSNIGQDPALSVYVIVYLMTRNFRESQISIFNKSGIPEYIPFIKADSDIVIDAHFNKYNIDEIYSQLADSEYVEPESDKLNFIYPRLVMITYFRSVTGQWFKLELNEVISGIMRYDGYDDETFNINMKDKLKDNIEFTLTHYGLVDKPLNVLTVTEEDVKIDLEKHGMKMPELILNVL